MKVEVRHWFYSDGWRFVPESIRRGGPEKEFDEEIVGWHCWVYTESDFEEWMQENMTGTFDVTPRFSSGKPMYTVHITKEEDAMFFKLRWQI